MRSANPALLLLALGASLTPSAARAGGEGWLTNLEEAQKLAKAEKKDVLVDFTGSDWCGWCVRLKKEVFDTEQWKAEGSKRFVLVELDFPRKPQPEAVRKYNGKLNAAFGVQGYPTIALLDAEGKPYAMTGYQAGGPAAYLKHLEELSARKAEIQRLVAAATAKEGAERASALDAAVAKLAEWRVAFGYADLREQVVALDRENKAGLGLKHAAALALHYAALDEAPRAKEHLELVRRLDPKQAETLEVEAALAKVQREHLGMNPDFKGALAALGPLAQRNPSGEVGAKVFFFTGMIKLRTGDKAGAKEALERCAKLAPESRFGQQAKQALQNLSREKRDGQEE